MRAFAVVLAALAVLAAAVPHEGPESDVSIAAEAGDCDVCPTGSTGAAHAAIRARRTRERAIADALKRQMQKAADAFPSPAAATGGEATGDAKAEEQVEEEVKEEVKPPAGRTWVTATLDVIGLDAQTLNGDTDALRESIAETFDAELGITKDDVVILEVKDSAPVSPFSTPMASTSFLQVDLPQLSSQLVVRIEGDLGVEGAIANELEGALEDGTLQSNLRSRSVHAELELHGEPEVKQGDRADGSAGTRAAAAGWLAACAVVALAQRVASA